MNWIPSNLGAEPKKVALLVAFVAIGRGEDELLACAALVVGGLKLLGHRGSKPVIVLRVDPKHGQISVLMG